MAVNPSLLRACLFFGDNFETEGLAGSPRVHNQYQENLILLKKLGYYFRYVVLRWKSKHMSRLVLVLLLSQKQAPHTYKHQLITLVKSGESQQKQKKGRKWGYNGWLLLHFIFLNKRIRCRKIHILQLTELLCKTSPEQNTRLEIAGTPLPPCSPMLSALSHWLQIAFNAEITSFVTNVDTNIH